LKLRRELLDGFRVIFGVEVADEGVGWHLGWCMRAETGCVDLIRLETEEEAVDVLANTVGGVEAE